jgi:hypothetical protein
VIRPAQDVLLEVLGDAAARGEANPARITKLSASVGPRMLLVEAWRVDSVGDDKVAEVVDEILVPLLST